MATPEVLHRGLRVCTMCTSSNPPTPVEALQFMEPGITMAGVTMAMYGSPIGISLCGTLVMQPPPLPPPSRSIGQLLCRPGPRAKPCPSSPHEGFREVDWQAVAMRRRSHKGKELSWSPSNLTIPAHRESRFVTHANSQRIRSRPMCKRLQARTNTACP